MKNPRMTALVFALGMTMTSAAFASNPARMTCQLQESAQGGGGVSKKWSVPFKAAKDPSETSAYLKKSVGDYEVIANAANGAMIYVTLIDKRSGYQAQAGFILDAPQELMATLRKDDQKDGFITFVHCVVE